MSLEREYSKHFLKSSRVRCNVPPQGGRKHPNQDYIQLDTANVLFICGGAFVDLDQIVEQRLGNRMVGYNSEMPKDKEELLGEVRPEDLVKYGLIPEFIGRLPVVSVLEELSQQELVKVLKETKILSLNSTENFPDGRC